MLIVSFQREEKKKIPVVQRSAKVCSKLIIKWPTRLVNVGQCGCNPAFDVGEHHVYFTCPIVSCHFYAYSMKPCK